MTSQRDLPPDLPENHRPWDRRILAYGEWLLRWRWPVILTTVALVLGLASGARNLAFNDDYRLFFSDDNPQLQAFEELQNVYTKNDNILFVLIPESGEIFSPKILEAVEDLTAAAWQIPFTTRVDSITNFQHTRAEEDDLIVADLVENAPLLSADEMARAKRIALAEPLLENRLISAKADATGVNAVLQMPGKSLDESQVAVQEARDLADRIERAYPGVQVHLTGFVMLNNAFSESSMDDMASLVPLMYLVILVLLAFLYRSVSATLSTLAVIGLSAAAGMGSAGWLGIVLTPPSAIAPTLIITLAVADSVHVLMGMLTRMREGEGKREAILESLRVNMWPVFLTSVTTAIGFLSMNFSDSPPFHDLGNMTAIGVMAAFVISLSFLPALVSILPLRVKKRSPARITFWEPFAGLVIRFRYPVLVATGLATVVFAALVPQNRLDDRFIQYFDESIPFRADTDVIVDRLTGIYQIEYSLGAGESGGISEPSYLAALDAFAEWWRAQPGVLHVRTLADTMKRVNRSMHGDDEALYLLPESRELAAQYLLLYELSLPYGLDLNDEINVDKSATRFTVTLENLSAQEMITAAGRGEAWLQKNAPASMFNHAVGPGLMFAHLTQRNIRSMLTGTFVALVLISAILVFALRSVRFGLLSLIPNLAPAAMAFGTWALVVGEVNMAVSMVVAMTLGIVVDDTVHFLSKYLRGRREHGLGAEGAVRYAFSSVGNALWTTSTVLVAGFLVLSLSSFEMNSGMGKLTAITIVFALVTDFLLLPSLLVVFGKRAEAPASRTQESPLRQAAAESSLSAEA